MIPTYEKQLELVEKGLATKKENGNLVTFKYHRNVMHKNLWKKDPALMECRGHTYDKETGKVVVVPFRKSFNYGENSWFKEVPLCSPVRIYKKYNGFMAAVTNGLVSTTGTTNSNYVNLAKEVISNSNEYKHYLENKDDVTYLFEINHESDIHIVEEEFKPKLLAGRYMNGQTFLKGEGIYCSLGQALEIAKQSKGEGYMIYPYDENFINTEYFCKVKSDRYRVRKALIRMTQQGYNAALESPSLYMKSKRLPELFYLYFTAFKHDFNDLDTELLRFHYLNELEQNLGLYQ